MSIADALSGHFEQHFSFCPSRQRSIGMEAEFPIVDDSGRAVRYPVIRGLFQYLAQQGFGLRYDSVTGEAVSAHRIHPAPGGSANYPADVISMDTGYSVLELSPAPAADLHRLHDSLQALLEPVLCYLDLHHAHMLGYGIQPISQPGRHLVAPKARYFLFKEWSSQQHISPEKGHDCDHLTLTASSQTHVDVSKEEMIAATNVMNGLAGPQIALLANSPVWRSRLDERPHAVREHLWERCFPQRSEQVAMPQRFSDVKSYLACLCGFRMQAVERDDTLYRVSQQMDFRTYLGCDQVQGEDFQGSAAELRPHLDDLYLQSGFAWFNARLAPRHGTMESRVACQQPPGESLCAQALTLGLIENLSASEALLNTLPWTVWRQCRHDALRHGLRACIQGRPITRLLEQLLCIAEQGLTRRGLGEAEYLAPLWKRLARGANAADQARKLFQQEGLDALLQSVSLSANPILPTPGPANVPANRGVHVMKNDKSQSKTAPQVDANPLSGNVVLHARRRSYNGKQTFPDNYQPPAEGLDGLDYNEICLDN